jgi:hypothetical protein
MNQILMLKYFELWMGETVVVQGAKGSLDTQAHFLHRTLSECIHCVFFKIINYKYVEKFNLCINNNVTYL